jgi:hypothetical protein
VGRRPERSEGCLATAWQDKAVGDFFESSVLSMVFFTFLNLKKEGTGSKLLLIQIYAYTNLPIQN